MRKCVYYVTISADGFIAQEDGSTRWMSGAPRSDYGFNEFYHGVGTIVMGRNTYDKILNMSDKNYFPYEDKKVIVASNDDTFEPHSTEIEVVGTNLGERIAREKINGQESDIWVAGGATLATALIEAGLLDEVHVFVQPILLGEGISLFNSLQHPLCLRLENMEKWPGDIVELRYLTVKSWRVDI